MFGSAEIQVDDMPHGDTSVADLLDIQRQASKVVTWKVLGNLEQVLCNWKQYCSASLLVTTGKAVLWPIITSINSPFK